MPFGYKDGPTTPQELLSEALYISSEIENCLLVVRYKDKRNQVHWTNLDAMTALGLANYATLMLQDGFLENLEPEETGL